MSNTVTYSAVFDERSTKFENGGINSIILSTIQMYCNDKLRFQGHLFLNEALDLLGLPRVREGQTAGWVWPSSKKRHSPHVDFGAEGDFLLGKKQTSMLNFNAQPDILDDVFGSVS